METSELQKKHDLTLDEVGRMCQRWGGHFTVQRGLWVPNGIGSRRKLIHEITHEPTRHPNIVTNEGLDHILDVELNALAALATWYLTGFVDNVTPLATHDYAVPGTDELDTADVAESVRETFNANPASSQALDNVAGPVAQYTADQAFTFFGAQLVAGSSAFQDVTDDAVHILFCSALLSPSIAMVTLATIDLTYTIDSSDT